MDVSEKLAKDAESGKAERFYEQALLLVDCCMIPDAIRLLEQAIQIKPDSEIYRESLAILQMHFLQTEEQGLSYANVARPKPTLGNGKENVSANQWSAKKKRTKESPTKTPWSPEVSSSCYSDTCEQSTCTIDNPWASFLSSNSKRKKPKGSPIDGISEIEIPSIDDNFYMQSPSYKQGYKHHDYQEQSDTPVTCNGPHKAIHKDGRSVQYTQDNHANASADYVRCNKDDLPESHFTNSHENVDTRFLEELCMARESATDDWAKYYDVLCGGLGDREEETCKQSDVLYHNGPRYCEYSDTLDEINETNNIKCMGDLEKDNSRSRATASMCGSDVCSKCGHSKESGNPPSSPTKNRVHFVNGACVSSPSVLNCTCNKQSKSCSEERTAKMPLSSSQQEFYRNLRYYFGSGKVKSKKVASESENEEKSSDLHKNSTSVPFNTCDTKDDDPLNVKSKQNVTETTQHSTKCESKNKRKTAREHVKGTSDNKCSESRKVKNSVSTDQVKTDKKSPDDERFQPAGFKQKARAHDKVQSKSKGPTKTEHVKNSKEGISQGNDSQRRQSGVKDGVRLRGNHKGRTEDISRPMTASEIREKRDQKHRDEDEQSSQAEIDFATVFRGIYQTGATVVSKCFQVSKSIIYYILLLIILLFGFLIYCVWFAACWLVKKVLHLTAAERLFTAVRSKISSLFEWLKKCRETRRKTSAQGQTYDLPKNGDAAIRHMLQNKDNDPYSVLGVPSDASDDDIRKQYRKLAVLIHPDKNPHSEADEAFKILANAFDILSDADKRSEYDRESAWKKRAEEREGRFGHPGSPEQFFADLGKKMQEMQNYLHCNQCDGKHRRYSTDRFVLTARFCSRCNTRHAAKEGDLWAESSFLGYKLHFYACMEGEVFDVTEWAACQGIGNYRLEPDPHTVHLKLKTRQTHPSGFNTRSEDEDFENFMRTFFRQFNPSREEKYHASNKQPKKRKRKKR